MNAGAQAPGGAGRGAPGARMPLALPWGRARAGTAASPARSREATAAAAATLWGARSLYFLYRSERGFQEEAGLGGQEVFFVKSLSAAARSPEPPRGTRETPRAAPAGPDLAAGDVGPGRRARAPSRGVLPPPLRRLPETREKNLEKSFQLGEESRGKEGAPARDRQVGKPRTLRRALSRFTSCPKEPRNRH